MNLCGLVVIGAAAALAGATPLTAQSLLLDRDHPRALWLEVARPSYRSGISGWLAHLGGAYRLSRQFAFVVDLPFGHAEYPPAPCTESCVDTGLPHHQTALGDPSLGVRFGLPFRGVDGELGFRLKALSGGSLWAGSVLNAAGSEGDYSRFEAFSSLYGSIRFGLTGNVSSSSPLRLRWRVGLMALLGGDGLLDGALDGGVAVTFERRRVAASAALNVRKPTMMDDSFYYSELGLALDYHAGNYAPSVFVRIPIGTNTAYFRTARYAIGIGLTLRLPDPPEGYY